MGALACAIVIAAIALADSQLVIHFETGDYPGSLGHGFAVTLAVSGFIVSIIRELFR